MDIASHLELAGAFALAWASAWARLRVRVAEGSLDAGLRTGVGHTREVEVDPVGVLFLQELFQHKTKEMKQHAALRVSSQHDRFHLYRLVRSSPR